MPHKRKVKREPPTKLLFQPENSFLYLRYFSTSCATVCLPLDSLLAIFVIKYIEADNIKVYLYKENEAKEFSIPVRKSSFEHELCAELPEQVQRCKLPVWYLPAQLTCLAGLCAVVRYIVKLSTFTTTSLPDHLAKQYRNLLGHMLNCLSAPAEVSTWTKFCELQMPGAVSKWLCSEDTYLPVELSQLESHLKQPIRIHNARKRMQDSKTLSTRQDGSYMLADDGEGNLVDPIKIYAQAQHIYAEGPDLLISDILLYPCISLVLRSRSSDNAGHPAIRNKFPVTARWFDKVSTTTAASQILDSLLEIRECDPRDFASVEPVAVADESLYKCDPKRDDCKNFTVKTDVSKNLEWWMDSGIQNLQEYDGPEENSCGLDWSSLPKLVHPQAGELPPARLERKCDQLQGLALPLAHIANSKREGCIIVDFCSGGGHLGLLLAHLLPKAVVHMVENKEESLARARERGQTLNLTNVWYFQANMEYYKGSFDIGTSLHACGVATDIVILKAMDHQADYVCTPCCYGAVRSIDSIQYPRSRVFREAGCTERDYIRMGHTADQTSKDPARTRQSSSAESENAGDRESQNGAADYRTAEGNLFMDIVDTDRSLLSVEQGYSVKLSKIYPLTCSPKHNIIIATRTN